MAETEGENGPGTEQPDTPVIIPEVTPTPQDPLPEGGDPEPQEADAPAPAEPEAKPGVLPMDQVGQAVAEMASEIEGRFNELFPGQLSEIDAVRDRMIYLDGERNGWRVDLVLKVRLRRG